MRIAGVDYKQVSEALGVDPVTVRGWEKRGIDKRTRLAFAAAFFLKPIWHSDGVVLRSIGGPAWIRKLK